MINPLVSILIPCYNAEKWVAQTLESALAQTWPNKEIIVVDDGSTDHSFNVMQSFIRKGVKVLHQENTGACAARNRALKEAQGDLIQYLDADDLLANDKIERQVKLFEKMTPEYVVSAEWGRFYNSFKETNFIKEPTWDDMSPVDWLICSWEGGGMMHPAAWMLSRVIAQKAGPWNEELSLNDDGEYFFRVLLASKGIRFCSGAKSYYRSGVSDSLSGKRSRVFFESSFKTIELCSSYLLAVEDSLRTRHACATSFQRLICNIYPDAPDLVRKAEAKVKLLGGSNYKPGGGPMFKFITYILGWKLAKQLQRMSYLILDNMRGKVS